jgi:uncharacterized protein YfaS (alpha-2-macroglobulin family)
MSSTGDKTNAREKRSICLRIAVLWLLASLACTVPGAQRSIDPLQTKPTLDMALPFATGVPKAETLPPALVETDPPPGSDIPLRPVFTFYFNQEMARSSIEEALSFQPPLDGKLNWLDSTAVQFVADRSLPPDTHLEINFQTKVRATNGLTLPEPLTLFFQTGGSLLPVDRLPEPDSEDVDPSSAMVVTFNCPVVLMGSKAEDFPPAFSIQPEASGRGEWLNTSSYVFYPDPPLMGGTRFTITLNSKLTSLDGAQLALGQGEMIQWEFTTAKPEVISWTEGLQPIPLDMAISLTFNQPMDTESVENRFSLADISGGDVGGNLAWNEEKTNLTFQPDGLLKRGHNYLLLISAGGLTKGGAKLDEFKVTYATMNSLTFLKLDPPLTTDALDIGNGHSSFAIEFSSPLADQNLSDLITLAPPVGGALFLAAENRRSVSVSGDFKPDTLYRLNLSSALKDKWGQELGIPLMLEIKTSPATPTLDVPLLRSGFPAIMVLPGDPNLQALTANINRVNIVTNNLSLQDFILLAASREQISNISSSPDKEWEQQLQVKNDFNQPIDIRLSPPYTPLKTGLYYYKVTGNTQNGMVVDTLPPFLAVSSQTHLLLKRSGGELFIWAVGLVSNRPLRDVDVSAYNDNFTLLGKCTTDREGLCRVNLLDADPAINLYAVVGKPGSPTFGFSTTAWSVGVDGGSFGIDTSTTTDPNFAFLYTDRSVYNPGEVVNFRAILRQKDNNLYTLPALTQVNVKVSGPQSIDSPQAFLTTIVGSLTSFGSMTGTYQLALDSPPGQYSLEIEEFASGKVQFQVTEYQRQEVDLTVETNKPDLLSSEDFNAVVNASYYFGFAVKHLALSWTLYSAPLDFKLPNGYQTGSPDYDAMFSSPSHFEGLKSWVQDGKGKTDSQGNLIVTVPSKVIARLTERGTPQKLTLEVTIDGISAPNSRGTTSVVLHPSDLYIGVRPETPTFKSGNEFGVSIQTVDSQQQVSGGQPLSASFQKATWKQKTLPGLSNPGFAMDFSPISATELITDGFGRARLAFIPPEAGVYELRLSGGGAETRFLIRVSGSGNPTWPDLPDQHLFLTADAELFQPGQTAHIFVANPFYSALALLTIEKDEVMEARVFTISESSLDLPISLDESDVPNVTISLTLLGNRPDGKPDFRQGYLDLKVSPQNQFLQVEMLSLPEKPEPADEVTYAFRVTDRQGNPVRAEFSLALVNKAAQNEADSCSSSIKNTFYGTRPLGIRTSMALAANARRIVTYQNQGEAAAEVPNLGRGERITGTAYWNGSLETNNKGLSEISFPLPDNQTTWVANICLVSEDTQVGSLSRELVVSKDLVIKPLLPNFLVARDHVELAADLVNNTDQNLTARVSLEAVGMVLDNPSQAVQQVEVNAGEKQRVVWWATAQNVDEIDLTFTTQSGSLNDKSLPEGGRFPVLRYNIPMTDAASGIMTAGSEQVEAISLPRSFTPTTGALQLEIETSLGGAIIASLDALEKFPQDFPEAVTSRLLPNLATYETLQLIGLDYPAQKNRLDSSIKDAFILFSRIQNEDGGWGWTEGQSSDPNLSAYILLGLVRAEQAGLASKEDLVERGLGFIEKDLQNTLSLLPGSEMDLAAFQLYVLTEAGRKNLDPLAFYAYHNQLTPWAQAFLALTLDSLHPGSEEARSLLDRLQDSARNSTSGLYWEDTSQNPARLSTVNFTTSVVLLAFSKLNPDSPVADAALRYLITSRSPTGGWASGYETAWVLLALAASLQTGGELQASFPFSASLNGVPVISGRADGRTNLLPVMASVPLHNFQADAPNLLKIVCPTGEGTLYYRTQLQVSQLVDDIPALTRGMTLNRRYLPVSENCANRVCEGRMDFPLSGEQPLVQARLSLTVPEDMYYVVIEDNIPGGAEILNTAFEPGQKDMSGDGKFISDFRNPFGMGWGWEYFDHPQIYDDHIRWAAPWLPAGTYELIYLMRSFLAGDFRVLPGRAYNVYFPENEGQTAGGVIHFSQ